MRAHALNLALWGGRASPKQHSGSVDRRVQQVVRARSLRVVLPERRVFRPRPGEAWGDSGRIPAVGSRTWKQSSAVTPRQCNRQPPEIAFLQLAPRSQQVHGHEDVAVMKECASQPGHAINLHAAQSGRNSEPNWRVPFQLFLAKLRPPGFARLGRRNRPPLRRWN